MHIHVLTEMSEKVYYDYVNTMMFDYSMWFFLFFSFLFAYPTVLMLLESLSLSRSGSQKRRAAEHPITILLPNVQSNTCCNASSCICTAIIKPELSGSEL